MAPSDRALCEGAPSMAPFAAGAPPGFHIVRGLGGGVAMKRLYRWWMSVSTALGSGVGFAWAAPSAETGFERRYAMCTSACTNWGRRRTVWPTLLVTAACSKRAAARCAPMVRVIKFASRTNDSQASMSMLESGLPFLLYWQTRSESCGELVHARQVLSG